MKKETPLVSPAELEALIHGWGSGVNPQNEDKFFALRFWFVAVVSVFYIFSLLSFPGAIAKTLSSHQVEIDRITHFLYFRGWFLAVVTSFVIYCYIRNWYLGIVLSAVVLLACVNFVFDLFTIYGENLIDPGPRLTAVLILRIVCIVMLSISIKNLSRLPVGKNRWSVFSSLKKHVHSV
jgi:hypothetical protein